MTDPIYTSGSAKSLRNLVGGGGGPYGVDHGSLQQRRVAERTQRLSISEAIEVNAKTGSGRNFSVGGYNGGLHAADSSPARNRGARRVTSHEYVDTPRGLKGK